MKALSARSFNKLPEELRHNRIIRRLLSRFAILFSLISASAYSACDIEDISAQLADSKPSYLFTQSKTIASLSRALNSSGVIWMSPTDELVWQVQKPVRSTTVISANGVKQFNRRDELQPSIDNPFAADLSTIFLSLLTGDFAALESSFAQSLSCDGDHWELTLEPRSGNLADLLSTLSVTGAENMESVSYRETRGDLTEIQLSVAQDDSSSGDNFRVYLDD